MKQILQNLKTGETIVAELPCPMVSKGNLLVQSSLSLISAGTERMLLEFGKGNMIDKARQQPEKVKMVLEKMRTDGVFDTIDAVRAKLDQPLPLGYSNVGKIHEIGNAVHGYEIGDRVVSNGHHAEYVCVPKNLCAKIPDNVSDEAASFTVVGAIALQGIRLVAPTLGERVVVIGLGLIGLITVQLLRANGCQVLGMDFDPDKLALAEEFGAQTINLTQSNDPVADAMSFSGNVGVDAVIITASTKSNDPVTNAARMSRQRGRIVLVGVTGLQLNRADFFAKELTFQVSCSYGPGRYDANYEDKGQDYPVGFVRWTEQRNFEAFLSLLSQGQVSIDALVSHRFVVEDAPKAYGVMTDGVSKPIGILLTYPEKTVATIAARHIALAGAKTTISRNPTQVSIGLIGAGNFASRTILPALKSSNVVFQTIASRTGVSGYHHGTKHGFQTTTTDTDSIFTDDKVNTVIVATRHNTHAQYALQTIEAGKNLFMEKPLALTMEELGAIEKAYQQKQQEGAAPLVAVGFNRRFAPLVVKMKKLLDTIQGPKTFIYTVNAGMIPAESWIQDPDIGGGRIIGEACHFIDLLRFLSGSPILNIRSTRIGDVPSVDIRDDKATITVSFADGSHGSIHYFANGPKSFPKERIEAFGGDAVLSLNNFRSLHGYGYSGFKKDKSTRQDKGHSAFLQAFISAITEGKPAPVSFDEIMEVSRAAIQAAQFDEV